MKDFIEVLGKIAAEADKVKKMAYDALEKIPKEEFNTIELHEKPTMIVEKGFLYHKDKKIGEINNLKIDKNLYYKMENSDTVTAMNTKKLLQDYCIENRCWAAMDRDGKWSTFADKPKYIEGYRGYWMGKYRETFESHSIKVPIVSYDKSLIAPDGRLILVEGRKEKKKKEVKFKAGKWYRSKRNSSIIHCQEVLEKNIIKIDGLTKNGVAIFCVDNLSDWYEMKHYNPNKKKKPSELKRGAPIFVWNANDPEEIPAIVRYFHSYSYCGVYTFINDRYGTEGTHYTSFRKYDPRLVGVPRKDWEDMPYA